MSDLAKRHRAGQAWGGIAAGRLGATDWLSRSRSRLHVKAVGSFVPALTKKAFEKHGFSAATLIMDWQRIVGSELASVALPERVKWPRVPVAADPDSREGRVGATLVLKVDPASALEVEYGARQIVERVNGYFGYRAVAEIRIIQVPVDPPRRRDHVPEDRAQPSAPGSPGGFGEGPLAEALARLEAGVKASGRQKNHPR
ncbi:MAG: DciA family protein [Hyphomicrobium sp.]|nr:DciA family protein [Hyphomicrobium sp.]